MPITVVLPIKELLSRKVRELEPVLYRLMLPVMRPVKSRLELGMVVKSDAVPVFVLVTTPPVPGSVEVAPATNKLPIVSDLPLRSSVAPGFTFRSLAFIVVLNVETVGAVENL